MDLGHGFIPRIDARNYKAVEQCLTRDGPGLFHEALNLPWAVLEGPWALQDGAATLELCRDRGVSVLVDTQAWRYHDARTFRVDKFTAPPYAPDSPLSLSALAEMQSFVAADLEAQAALGAAAFLLPGAVPKNARDDIDDITLGLIDAARTTALAEPRPCVAFIGAHSSSMERAHALIDRLPLWLEGVYIQVTPSTPLRDSTAKLIDALVLMRHAAQRGFTVLGGRMAALRPLARALGIHGTDAGLGEGESFVYASKMKNHEPRAEGASSPRLLGGRVYVSQLGRSVSSAEWSRLMTVPALRGQLLCRLPCCAFGQPVESTPSRGREHSLHSRVAEARQHSAVGAARRRGDRSGSPLTRLPRVSGRDLVKALQQAGYEQTHVRGSHHYLRRLDGGPLITVPVHGTTATFPSERCPAPSRPHPRRTRRPSLTAADLGYRLFAHGSPSTQSKGHR